MPRRRPARMRMHAQIRSRQPAPRQIPGIPKNALHAISRWERGYLWPGAVAEAYDRYSRYVNGRGRVSYGLPGATCPCCVIDYEQSTVDPRSILHQALAQLPATKGRKLRRMVAELDARYLARSLPDPWADPNLPWWLRRCTW